MKLIDKSALVAEIKRRVKEYQSTGDDYWFPVIENLKNILSFLDTLEVKEVEEEPYVMGKTGKFTTTTKQRRKEKTMDKLAKVRAEVARIQLYTQSETLKQVLDYIDEVQKEEIPQKFPLISPKKCMYTKDDFTDEDRKVLCDGCKEECEYAQKEEPAPKILEDMLNAKTPAESLGISAEEHDKIIDLCLYGKEPEMVAVDDLPKEEPVSEDLEEAIDAYLATYFGSEKEKQEWPFLKKMAIYFAEWKNQKDSIPVSEDLEKAATEYVKSSLVGSPSVKKNAFKAGAKWQKKRDYIPLSDDINEVAKQIWNKVLNYEIDYKEDDVVLSDEEECVKAGIRWQMQKESIPSKDLGEYINELSKQFPEVSFAKLSRIAVRVAKWQKEQMMAKAGNGRVDSVSNRQTRAHITVVFDSPRDIEVLDRLKVIVIKGD